MNVCMIIYSVTATKVPETNRTARCVGLPERDPRRRGLGLLDTGPDKPPVRVPVRHVLRGRDLLCFSHDWAGDPLSKTHIMRLLARDNRVLWVNSIGYRAPTVSKADIGRVY